MTKSNPKSTTLPPELKPIRRSLFWIATPAVFITFALPLRAEDLGATAFEIGVLYAIFTASLFVVRPTVGIGLDMFGRRTFFLSAMLLYFAANIAYALSDTVNALYAARLFQGVGFAILTITTDTMTSDVTRAEERAAAMGGNIASQTRGGMVGAFIGFGLVGAMPAEAWRYSFLIFSVVAFLATAFAMRAVPETMAVRGERNAREKFKMPPHYARILTIIFAAAFAGALIQPFYLIYLRARFDLELYWLATAFLPIGIAYAVLPTQLGRATGRLSRAAAMGLGLLIAALFYILVPAMNSFALVIAAFLGAAIGAVLVELTRNAWVGDLSPAGAAGRTFGLAALAAGGGAALGPLAGGAIYDAWGADYLFYFASAILAVSAFVVVRWLRR